MAVTKTDGTANLRAEPNVYDATTSSAFEKDEKAGAGGKDMGGTDNMRAQNQTFRNTGDKDPSASPKNSWPAGVQTFNPDLA